MTAVRDRAGALALARAALARGGGGASNNPPPGGAFELRGAGEARGVPVAWARAWDAAGRLRDAVSGALSSAAGFDGASGWRVDEAGMPGALELGDLEELCVSQAAWSGAWCRESGPGAPVSIDDGIRLDGATAWLSLRAAGGLRRFRLALDTRTGLPSRLERAGRDDTALVFEDFRAAPCGLVPHTLVRREGWLADTLRVEVITASAAPPDFAAPTAEPADIAFDDAAGAAPLEQRWSRARLPLVRAHIDGRDAGWFALDTGASACAIEASVAAKLGLPELGRRFVRTADGASGAPYRRAGALRVGPAVLRDVLLLELDLAPFARAAGVALGGVLGYDVFRRARVSLDGAQAISIDPPAAPVAASEAGWLPLQFEDGLPVIAARYAGAGTDAPREGLFAIDTGSSIALTLTAGAAPSFSLKGGARVSMRGAGGAASAVARTLAWLELGGARVEEIDALVARPGAGALGDPEPGAVAGLIGMGLLRDFSVIFDYPRRRMRIVTRSRWRGTLP